MFKRYFKVVIIQNGITRIVFDKMSRKEIKNWKKHFNEDENCKNCHFFKDGIVADYTHHETVA